MWSFGAGGKISRRRAATGTLIQQQEHAVRRVRGTRAGGRMTTRSRIKPRPPGAGGRTSNFALKFAAFFLTAIQHRMKILTGRRDVWNLPARWNLRAVRTIVLTLPKSLRGRSSHRMPRAPEAELRDRHDAECTPTASEGSMRGSAGWGRAERRARSSGGRAKRLTEGLKQIGTVGVRTT